MHASFKAFMRDIIDYAGLFPPAKLPLGQAFSNYLRFKDEAEAWMLAKFICPVKILKDLIPYKNKLQENSQLISLTVLPVNAEIRHGYLERFRDDVQAMDQFLQQVEQYIRIEALEIRIFPELLNEDKLQPLHLFLKDMNEILISAGMPNIRLFLELNQSDRWIESVKLFAEEIALFNQIIAEKGKSASELTAGLKLRCGGEKPENVPSWEEVAQTIYNCVAAGIPFKATAGLHHPLRYYDTTLKTKVYGFLNIFGSALLAFHHQVTPSEIQSILLEEDPKQFIFDANSFKYKQWRMDTDEIMALRRESVISFGSCSFDEPREDLAGLGLLDN